VIESKL